MSVGRSSVSRGTTGLAKACSRTDGPVAATKRASWLCGRAFNPSRTAIATDAEAADSIHQSRPEIARAAGEPSMSRITLDILLLGIADDRAFDRRVRPDVQVRRGEAVQAQDRGDLRAMVAAMVRELHERNPQLEVGLAPLDPDPPVELELTRREELFDGLAHPGEARRDLVERRPVGRFEERRWDEVVRVEVALVGPDDVRERLPDRAVGAGGGEKELGLAQHTAAGEERLGRPHVVPHLAEHRRRGHRPTEGTPWRVVAHPD